MAYNAVHLVTVSRLFALTVTGSALLFLAPMANSLLLALWIMSVYSFSTCFREYRAESCKTVHIVELDSGTTKSELRGHDNVVEAAVFVPVSCLPSIRELLGQKVPSYFLPLIITLLSSFIASCSAERRCEHLVRRDIITGQNDKTLGRSPGSMLTHLREFGIIGHSVVDFFINFVDRSR